MKQKLLATKADKTRLLDALARGLEPDEMILQLVDTYRASGKVTVQIPLDPSAEVVLTEPPRLQPGGITELIAYVRAKDRSVRDVTFHGESVERDVEYTLKPVRSAGM